MEKEAEQQPQVEPHPPKTEIRVLYQDKYMAIVSKPPNMVVHPSDICQRDGEIVFLIDVLAELFKTKVYFINRLDAQTSGIIVVALDSSHVQALKESLKEEATIKEYITLVRGSTPDKWVETRPLTKLSKKSKEQQAAETRFERVSEFYNSSLLRAQIVTGRRHQIRRHLASKAHQIIGDRMYGKGRINNMARDLYGLQRMFLHSYRLVFVHPFTKQQISLVDPLPTDLTDFLKKLPEFKVETLNLL